MKPKVQLNSQIIEGFVGACLMKGFDGASKIPEFHKEMWDMCCSDSTFVAIAAPRG